MRKIILFILLCLSTFSFLYAEEVEEDINSDYYLLIDVDSKEVLLSKDSNDLIYPASITKAMSLLVGIENIEDYNARVVLDSEIFSGLYEANASMAGYSLNEEVSIEDCLYGLFLPSGAEATRCIAHHVSGSESEFVELMNIKAQELGMNNTNFANTTGLHDDNHYTTLSDLAIMLDYALQNEKFYEIFTTETYTAENGLLFTSTALRFANALDEDHNILGGKTGYTGKAGLTLASIASDGNINLMFITAMADVTAHPNHVQDAINVYQYYFDNFERVQLVDKDVEVGLHEVEYKMFNNEITLYPKEDLSKVIPNDYNEIIIAIQDKTHIQAPVFENTVVAKGDVIIDGNYITTIDLISKENVKRNNLLYYWDMFVTFIGF